MSADELHERMGRAIDEVLDTLEVANGAGVEINPLTVIMERLQARGSELDLSEMDPLTRMVLGGMTE